MLNDIISNMLSEQQAQALANHWIEAWNSHNLEEIMTHYPEDVVLTSPVAARILGDPSGTVSGKAALQAYFKRGLETFPDLRFELADLLWGLSSVVLYYSNQNGSKTAEYMELGSDGKVTK